MSKALVIVESPAKAKTINQYLGNQYLVKSSIGHIRDLPINNVTVKQQDQTHYQTILASRMGIDPYDHWLANYEILPGKEKLVNELKALAEKAEHIYLATDLDREGEAIAWHIKEVIGGDNSKFSRVVFNEITRNAIAQAFQNPRELNLHRINAQQTRRFIDRIVGYMISPLLWKKIARGLSAGRVQSVTVRLIVERERKIKTFLPKEYWELYSHLQVTKDISLKMQVTHLQNKPFKPVNYSQIQSAIALLKTISYIVCYREDNITSSNPNAPFITSTLQQAASNRLGYSVKQTMLFAQQLYEAGYITYMRTDSTKISQEAINLVRNYIIDIFGQKYLPNHPNQYISKKNTLEAHEAIRPSNVYILAEQLENIEESIRKLYQLIWRQFVSSQMMPAQYNYTKINVTAGDFQLSTTERTLYFDGWTKVMPMLRKKDEESICTSIDIGHTLSLQELIPKQNFTQPPLRYSEASLVKELEKRRIGRPSTYMSIIESIQDRGYVKLENHRFYANKIGEIVIDRLTENFSELMSYDFTAHMEDTLDKVATNQQNWKSVLDNFFMKLNQQLEIAQKAPAEGGMFPNRIVTTNINCPICGRVMGIRTAHTGVFLNCSGYKLSPNERCKHTINLISKFEWLKNLDSKHKNADTQYAQNKCIKCGNIMDSYLIDDYKMLHICNSNPLCDGYQIEQGQCLLNSNYSSLVQCEKCGANMQFKIGRFGKYIACINDKCKNTRNILRNGDIAPPKMDLIEFPELPCKHSHAYFVLRHGPAGIFLAANTFPKVHETRAPLVEELVRFKDRLPKILHYLTEAPIQDDQGNKTLVRFSRKTKQQYVSSNKTGQATWKAFFIQGHWQVHNKKTDKP